MKLEVFKKKNNKIGRSPVEWNKKVTHLKKNVFSENLNFSKYTELSAHL